MRAKQTRQAMEHLPPLTAGGGSEAVRLIRGHDSGRSRDLHRPVLMVGVAAVAAKEHGLRGGGSEVDAQMGGGGGGGGGGKVRRRRPAAELWAPAPPCSTCQAAMDAGSLLARFLPVSRPVSSGLLRLRGTFRSAMAGGQQLVGCSRAG